MADLVDQALKERGQQAQRLLPRQLKNGGVLIKEQLATG